MILSILNGYNMKNNDQNDVEYTSSFKLKYIFYYSYFNFYVIGKNDK